jgi:hypothetical protein
MLAPINLPSPSDPASATIVWFGSLNNIRRRGQPQQHYYSVPSLFEQTRVPLQSTLDY